MTYTTVEEAQAGLRLAIEETLADIGDELECSEDDIAHDMVVAVAWECPDQVAMELCRRELGVVPYDLAKRLGHVDFLAEW